MSDSVCRVCEKPVLAKDLCRRHYKQMWRHGEIRLSRQEWLEKRLSELFTTECVEWPFHKDSKGYGFVVWNGKELPVAHLALAAHNKIRPDPPKNYALHACDTPACFNPLHLEWGSQKENMRQREERGRRTAANGEKVHTAKLTERDIPVIFAIKQLGFNRADIARMFDVGWTTIEFVLSRKTWRHVQISR